MSEFLLRGWNVAIPEVDIGDDIFVVKDDQGILKKVQVKSSTLKSYGNAVKAVINIKKSQITATSQVYFIFPIRKNNKWLPPFIIQGLDLYEIIKDNNRRFFSTTTESVTLNLMFKHNKFYLYKQNFSRYKENYRDFPILTH